MLMGIGKVMSLFVCTPSTFLPHLVPHQSLSGLTQHVVRISKGIAHGYG